MNQVTKKKENLPSTEKISLRDYAGQGTENIEAKDQKLPIMRILQSTNPQVQQGNSAYDEDARIGDIYVAATRKNYGKKITVVPCQYINTFNEWKGSRDGVSRPTVHMNKSILDKASKRDGDNRDWLPNGNYVEDTGNHFCYILDSKTYEPLECVLIPMASSQKGKSRSWNSIIANKTKTDKLGTFIPPTFSSVYTLSTVPEKNDKGSWIGWVIEFDKWLDEGKDDHILTATKQYYESLKGADPLGSVQYEEDIDVPTEQPKQGKQKTQIQTDDTPF